MPTLLSCITDLITVVIMLAETDVRVDFLANQVFLLMSTRKPDRCAYNRDLSAYAQHQQYELEFSRS